MSKNMPSERLDSAKVLGDDFTFGPRDELANCHTKKCSYRTPDCPGCCGCVNDSECCILWPCVANTGMRNVGGCKLKKCETCCSEGGYCCCCANACEFPPSEKVPLGCGCCSLGMIRPITKEGLGLDYEKDVALQNSCLCYHFGCFFQWPKCCGAHSKSECCCSTSLMHCALDPIEAYSKGRSTFCCVETEEVCCPKPCWPCCMFQDEACCC